jgi:hypothetical protein
MMMSTLRIPAATATSLVALLCASTSFAQETTPKTTATTPATTQPAQTTQPSQTTTTPTQPGAPQQPSVSVTVEQPAQQPQQVGTTRTTAAPYTAPSGDRYSERTIEHRPNRTLLSTGTGIFVLSYGSSVVAGAVSDRDEDKRLFIPVVGPWMDLANRDCGANPCGGTEDVAKAMIITSGIVQGAGVLMALGSLLIPESTSVSERTSAGTRARPSESAHIGATKPEIRFAPVSFAAGAGLGAVGRF